MIATAVRCLPSLAQRFRDNDWDIAGLADLPDDACLADTLQQVNDLLDRPPGRLSEDALAAVLFVLLRVAQDDFSGEGYWPEVFRRLHRGRSQAEETSLGQWFFAALDQYDYRYEDQPGPFRYVREIEFHAGLPRTFIPRFATLVRQAFPILGLEPEVDELNRAVREYGGGLPVALRNLLTRGRRGAVLLWSALAQVYAARSDDEREAALDLLPPSVDRAEVRLAFGEAPPPAAAAARAVRLPRPRLRYHEDQGEVWLELPEGTRAEWSVAGVGALCWRPEEPPAAMLFSPPTGGRLEVRRGPIGRAWSFLLEPTSWPGLWFRARTGELEPGERIDREGLEPGKWIALVRGEPAEPPGARLATGWSQAGQRWSAWLVEVPPRRAGQPRLQWTIDGRTCSVRLARDPGPAVSLTGSPILHAVEQEGASLPVFAAAEQVGLRCGRSQRLFLMRRRADGAGELLESINGEAGRALALPELGPGVYAVRDFRRALAEFAIIPGLRVDGLAVTDNDERVALALAAQRGAGWPETDDREVIVEPAGGGWRIAASSVPPALELRWRWPARVDAPALTLRWNVPAMRWRVLTQDGTVGPWRRELVLVHQPHARPQDRLEVQAPGGAAVRINGQERPSQALPGQPSRVALDLPLQTAVLDGLVVLEQGERRWEAVLVTLRPTLNSLELLATPGGLHVNWQPAQSQACQLLVWDIERPDQAPAEFVLPAGRTSRTLLRNELPAGACLAVTLARISSGFGGRRIAVALQPPAQKALVAAARRDEQVLTSWQRFLLEQQVRLLSAPGGDLLPWQQGALAAVAPLPFEDALAQAERLRRPSPLFHLARQSLRRLADGLELFLRQRGDWLPLLQALPADPPAAREQSLDWLRRDVHLGWLFPERLAGFPWGNAALRELPCPLGYYHDLERISPLAAASNPGPPPPGEALQARIEAAERLFRFHQDNDLPDPGDFLPWRQRRAHLRDSQGRRHEIDLPAGLYHRPLGPGGSPTFCRLLGLVPLVPIGATEGRPLRQQRQLLWDVASRRWACRRSTGALGRGWMTAFDPGSNVLEMEQPDWAAWLQLPARLRRWSADVGELPHRLDGVARLDEVLLRGAAVREVHAAVLETRLPEAARLAWRLAWVDRLCVFHQDSRVLAPSGPLPWDRPRFLGALRAALLAWPVLMLRTLALAELLRVLLTGGPGLAARFVNCRNDLLPGT